MLTCVEPCRTFEIYRNRDTKHLQLQPRVRKCLFLYHYAVHPVFGFLNARIQTWFLFSIQICVNGREWLAHQMDAVGVAYLRHDNCFPWIEDWSTAQQLMNQQLKVDWPTLLMGTAYLYKEPTLRSRIDRLRQDQTEAGRVLESLRTRADESSRVLLLAKDRQVRELEARVKKLETELATCRGQLYERL